MSLAPSASLRAAVAIVAAGLVLGGCRPRAPRDGASGETELTGLRVSPDSQHLAFQVAQEAERKDGETCAPSTLTRTLSLEGRGGGGGLAERGRPVFSSRCRPGRAPAAREPADEPRLLGSSKDSPRRPSK